MARRQYRLCRYHSLKSDHVAFGVPAGKGRTPNMQSCEVAIVGAGVIGCSVAFHLARKGQRGVCLLEREALPGAGSTSKANGGIRAQFTTPVNVAMSLASMDILDALAPE